MGRNERYSASWKCCWRLQLGENVDYNIVDLMDSLKIIPNLPPPVRYLISSLIFFYFSSLSAVALLVSISPRAR